MNGVMIVDNLEQREAFVREGLDRIREWYYKVGVELAALYREEVWLKRGYVNWREYCLGTWTMTDSYASRLMSAADIYAQLPDGLRPLNESGYRPLSSAQPELRIPAMQWAVEAAGTGKVTADLVRLGVKVAAKVAEEALASHGYAETEDGKQQTLNAAITKEMLEEMLRNGERIASKSNWETIGTFQDSATRLMALLFRTGRDLADIKPDETIRVRIYREKPNGNSNTEAE